jgi:hypothetical protein
MSSDEPNDIKQLSLEQAATHLLEECRMVLPGIQALFGFQLVAVFSARFADALTLSEQLLHLVAIMCVVLAVALVMAPAVLHRRRQPEAVSRRFIELSSGLLMWSMAPLAAGTVLDVYLVSRIILGSMIAAGVIAAAASVVFVGLWVTLPARAALESGSPASQ